MTLRHGLRYPIALAVVVASIAAAAAQSGGMVMDIKIPEPLKVEHEELHAELVALTKAPGKVGEAARNVAMLLHPHFVKEEEYALPPLGLLAPIAQRGVTPEMRMVLTMTERLKQDLPQMLAEHQQVVGALEKLAAVGRAEARPGVDPISRRNFWDLIRTLAREGVTVFVTTHYMDEAEYCDRLALIYKGRLIALGTPDELKQQHMHEDVLEVAVDRSVEALEVLAREPVVREAAIFASLLHVVVADAARDGALVRAAVERAGLRVERLEKILPSLEDVFASLIEADRAAAAVSVGAGMP